MSDNSHTVIRKHTEGIAVALKWDVYAIKLAYEVEALEVEIAKSLKIANELTEETQTIEDAVTDLVRLVHQARQQRDDAIDELNNIETFYDG